MSINEYNILNIQTPNFYSIQEKLKEENFLINVNNQKMKDKIERVNKSIEKYNLDNKEEIDIDFPSIFNLVKKIDELNDEKYYSNNYISLIQKMKKSYFKKSFGSMKYFLFNISQKINKINGNKIVDFSQDLNQFIQYRNSIEFNVNGEYKLAKEYLKGKYLSNLDLQYRNKKVAKTKYIEDRNINNESLFITFTLPSSYTKYKMKKSRLKENRQYEDFTRLELNPNYNQKENFEKKIEEGLLKISEISSYFNDKLRKKLYSNFRTNSNDRTKKICKRLNIKDKSIKKEIKNKLFEKIYYKRDYVKVLEPQKNLSGHLHILQFRKEKDIEIVKEVYLETKEHFNLIQTDLEYINKNRAKPSTYILKYLTKNFDNDKIEYEKDWNFYNYYKRYFGKKTRFFITSDFNETTQEKINVMYSYVNKYCKELLDEIREKEIPIYKFLEDLEIQGIFKFEFNKKDKFTFDSKKLRSEYNTYFRKSIQKEKVEYLRFLKLYKSREKELSFMFDYTKQIKDLKLKYIKTIKHKKKIVLNRFRNNINKNISKYFKTYKYQYLEKRTINLYNSNNEIFNKYRFDILEQRINEKTFFNELKYSDVKPKDFNYVNIDGEMLIKKYDMYQEVMITDIKRFDYEINNTNTDIQEWEKNHNNYSF